MLGHGGEIAKSREDRPTLPDGVTLVTAVACGMSAELSRPGRVLRILKDNLVEAGNPVDLRNLEKLNSKIGIKFNVYEENQPYPSLWFRPESIQPGMFGLSGIVKLEEIDDDDINLMTNLAPTTQNKLEDVNISFRRSVWPTQEKARQVIVTNNTPFGITSIHKIFEALGAGVYYFPICRDTDEDKNVVALIRAESAAEQEKLREQYKADKLGRRVTAEQQRYIANRGFSTRRRPIGGRGKRMKKRLTKRRKYGTRRTAV